MKKYRKQAKLTQEKLAELCNTDHRYIGQIETGRRAPSLEFVGRIAIALNVAPHLLFYAAAAAEPGGQESRLSPAQKENVKALLRENLSRVCARIDERF